jgi:4-amino-4-deoxy-L-arabinose transferase-like glycosyltransferase
MFQAARFLTDGMRFGPHGLWMISSHRRNYISPVTPHIALFATGKTKRKSLFVLHSPKSGNALEALTWLYYPLGTYFISPKLTPYARLHSWCFSAYSPRAVMSNMHASPADAVRIFKDVKAKKALAMHWG